MAEPGTIIKIITDIVFQLDSLSNTAKLYK
jgi:hypothetical protein